MFLRVFGRINSDHSIGRVEEQRCELETRLATYYSRVVEKLLTVLAIRVLPVPEGPAIKKLATGLLGFASPLRESLTALATALTAADCPMTCSASTFSSLKSFSFSLVTRRVTGMFVHLATISAI